MWFSTNEDLVREAVRERERQLKRLQWVQRAQQPAHRQAPVQSFWRRIMAAVGFHRPRAPHRLEVVGGRTSERKR
jgi:hypothetical protein